MTADVLILIDQQKAMSHPKWGPRNNPGAEQNIARLLAAWRSRGLPIIHVKHDSTSPESPFRPGQEGTDVVARLEAMGRPPLVICGVLLANSVEASARNAANLGFTVRLPADAVLA